MKNRIILFSGFIALSLTVGMAADSYPVDHTPPAPRPVEPTWNSLATHYQCPEWFRDAKFGIWAHWGPQSVPEQGDWYGRLMYIQGGGDYNYHVKTYGHPSVFGYKDILPLWKAEKWKPDELMALYKKSGARYFFAQANHHDNFDNWNSTFQEWNSVNIGLNRILSANGKRRQTNWGSRSGSVSTPGTPIAGNGGALPLGVTKRVPKRSSLRRSGPDQSGWQRPMVGRL